MFRTENSCLHVDVQNNNVNSLLKHLSNGTHKVFYTVLGGLKLNAPTLFTANQRFQHSQLSTRDRLTVLRQIIEALIHLKNLGIVHTTVSSYSIYLADPDHAKLANFEHALPWREWCEGRGKWIPETRLSEAEIVHLGAWLAPEVVLLSRSPELNVESEAQIVSLRAKSGNNGDSAYHSTFGIGDAGCGIYCTLTPATDTFGVARVMQELFEPHCVHRFCRPIPTTSKRKLLKVLEGTEERKLHFYLRPAIKKALRHEFTARGEIEDLHIAIVRAFRTSVKTVFAASFENKSEWNSANPVPALPSSSPFLKSDLEMPLPRQSLSNSETKLIRTRQETKNITISNAISRIRRQLEDVCFQKTSK
ncbi:unnamed protein product [Taenia asiatica]|uniref:Protein kinase domain-containing protein n=1 Tax=Taenia asiatica TaxID=60517 RepID=A0A0R3W2A0_TAEAS|nr:unnamed protein product [Taenia asiatica]